MKTSNRFLIAVGMAILSCAGVCAQTVTTGDIAGVVADSSGAVVPNAAVSLKSVDTGDTRSMQSGQTGAYRFTMLRPATYQISVTSPGLTSDTTTVAVVVGQVATMNLVLKPQSTREVIFVSETAPLLKTENANIGSSYSSVAIDLLPMPGGDITALAFSMPGVVMATAGSGAGGYGSFSSYGLPATANLFTMNGNDNMDPYLNLNNTGATNLTLGASEVDQVSVIQNAYSGQYGRQAGAQVNYTTKSGTNAFHGSLSYSWNGAKLNANDFFNNATETPRPFSNSNQYGVSGGGRIVKDKLFFFASTEGLRYVLPSSETVSVPSPALQTYVLSTVSSAQRPFYQKAFDLYNQAPGIERAVPVTFGTGPLQDSYNFAADNYGGLGCGTLAGTPNGLGGIFGVNVGCANAFNNSLSNKSTEWLFSSRVDYNLNEKHRLYWRFKTDHGLQPTQTSAIGPIFNAESNQPSYEGQLVHTFVITPRTVNSFIGSSNWYSALFAPKDLNASIQAFPSQILIYDGGANGTGGFTQMGMSFSSFPQGRRVGQLQLTDDLSHIAGAHSLKFGINYRYNRVTDLGIQPYVNGGRFLLYGLDEFANGAIDPTSGSYYAQRYASLQTVHLRLYNVGFYGQDEWAIKPNLKLTAALRLERTGNPHCVDNCFSMLTGPFDTLSKGASIPYNQSIVTGKSEAYYKVQSITIQPRVGLVYNPSWSKRTVIRGGIGLFSDMPPATLASSLFRTSPNVFTPSVRTGTVNSGGAGSAPAISIATGSTFMNGFTSGFTVAQMKAALAPVSFTEPGYFVGPAELRSPKYWKWSFEIQQGITENSTLTVSYVGNHGSDLLLQNPKVNSYASASAYPNGFGGLPSTAPDPRFRIVTQLTNLGYSNFDGLTVLFQRGFGHGFQGQVGYTWSHGLDTISNGGAGEFFNYNDSFTTMVNPNVASNYSSSDYDIRHNVTADFVWEIPVKGQGLLMKNVLGGWSLSSKWYIRTGTPFGVYNSKIPGRLGVSTGGAVVAQMLDPTMSRTCKSITDACFTASQFATSTTQTGFGNMERNFFRGPGYFNIDLSVYKSFRVGERLKFRVGATAYNFLNHPSFGNPAGDAGASGLGTISSAVTPPTSPYGSFQGSAVSGRVVVLNAKLDF